MFTICLPRLGRCPRRPWVAPCERRIGGRLILLCRGCDRLPDAAARLNETVVIDWSDSHGRGR
jgi:hypothetical protein